LVHGPLVLRQRLVDRDDLDDLVHAAETSAPGGCRLRHLPPLGLMRLLYRPTVSVDS
jgi:hypothetical protein